jgi:hypothetical protein
LATTEALDLAYDMGLPIDDTDKIEELSKGFHDHSGGFFDGGVIAIDGLLFSHDNRMIMK